jgi:hypothetical protein
MKTIKAWECFDADSGKDLAVELREYFIPDFSNWKERGQFEIAFARLLKDLRSEDVEEAVSDIMRTVRNKAGLASPQVVLALDATDTPV